MPMINDIERLHGRIAELEARVIALEVMAKFPKTLEALKDSEDGWITWNGGDRPVSGETPVYVKFRTGDIEQDIYADSVFWDHKSGNDDIIAYRISKYARMS